MCSVQKTLLLCCTGLLFLAPSFLSAARDIPFLRTYNCFWEAKNEHLPSCKKFYTSRCPDTPLPTAPRAPLPLPLGFSTEGEGPRLISVARCPRTLACPKFVNPVYDAKGTYYPSACWAEHLGITTYTHGISKKTRQFFSDLWREQGYDVLYPSIEFTYNGSGWPSGEENTYKSGVFIRSTIWKDPTTLLTLDYNIHTNRNRRFSPSLSTTTLPHPPRGKRKVLLAYVPYEKAYPDELLLQLSQRYADVMNDYFRKKQHVRNSIQIAVTPVILSPPLDTTEFSSSHLTKEQKQKIYRTAMRKAKEKDFDTLIFTPIGRHPSGFGGSYYTSLDGKDFIAATLSPQVIYSEDNAHAGIQSLWFVQDLFSLMSHELLHAFGLDADHVPSDTYFTDAIGANLDPVTGRWKSDDRWDEDDHKKCAFYGTSSDYYAMELPKGLHVHVGEEPPWSTRIESDSGPCLVVQSTYHSGWMLKDRDGDGVYEMMYHNALINEPLQRILGWVDVDGDGIAELDDPHPYGGMQKEF